MSLKAAELASVLTEISSIHVGREAAAVMRSCTCHDRSLVIDPKAVREHSFVTGPTGARALHLVLDIDAVPVQVIVAPDDLRVRAGYTRRAGCGIKIHVTDAPPLVSFSEMVRDLDKVARKLSTEKNFDHLVGALVMLRYFVAGSKRLRIECHDAESKLREHAGSRSGCRRRNNRSLQSRPQSPSTRRSITVSELHPDADPTEHSHRDRSSQRATSTPSDCDRVAGASHLRWQRSHDADLVSTPSPFQHRFAAAGSSRDERDLC